MDGINGENIGNGENIENGGQQTGISPENLQKLNDEYEYLLTILGENFGVIMSIIYGFKILKGDETRFLIAFDNISFSFNFNYALEAYFLLVTALLVSQSQRLSQQKKQIKKEDNN